MRIGIIGCGVVGAAIAYRLSSIPGLEVLVYDSRSPQQFEATGAALGVLMAAISGKLKGRHLKLRLESLGLYESLIPQLEQQTGLEIPYNREGILQLYFEVAELKRFETLQAVRQTQGFDLELWSLERLSQQFPELAQGRSLVEGSEGKSVVGAVYSPQDRQVDPVALTQGLVQGALQQGANIHFETGITGFRTQDFAEEQLLTHLQTVSTEVPVDWVVVSAGLGSTPLTQALKQPIAIQPVLGQAIHLRSKVPLRSPCPVVNGCDVHLVPMNDHELWVGATVEFPEIDPLKIEQARITPSPQALDLVLQQAIALYPALADAEVLRTWQGFRPRPQERAAPVIERLPGYGNVLIASGHYRNGVLLAPITAEKIWSFLQAAL